MLNYSFYCQICLTIFNSGILTDRCPYCNAICTGTVEDENNEEEVIALPTKEKLDFIRQDVLSQLNPYIDETISVKDLATVDKAMVNYAIWFTEQVIKYCAEVARTRTNNESTSIIVDKESILKVEEELTRLYIK